MLRCLALFVASVLLWLAAPAQAQLTAHFYARDFGSHYPHALVRIDGRLASGERVAVNYGFTARTVTRDVMMRPVPGYVQTLDAAGMATMERAFSMAITDAAYRRLLARVAAWQRLRQPGYDLHNRNCVHFVMDLGSALGLKVNGRSAHFKQPRRFLDELRALNRGIR